MVQSQRLSRTASSAAALARSSLLWASEEAPRTLTKMKRRTLERRASESRHSVPVRSTVSKRS